MSTGHSSTQAPQVVQAQSTSGSMTLGTRAVNSPSPASNGVAEANMLSRRAMISSLGDRGFSVFQAGQADWQRPHSVQVAKSNICFHEKWPTSPTPKTVSSSMFSMSMSGVLSRAPRARGRREKATLMGAMKMWRCLE